MIETRTNEAEIVPCRYCGARERQHCINKITNESLRENASHTTRTRDASRVEAIDNDDDDELF